MTQIQTKDIRHSKETFKGLLLSSKLYNSASVFQSCTLLCPYCVGIRIVSKRVHTQVTANKPYVVQRGTVESEKIVLEVVLFCMNIYVQMFWWLFAIYLVKCKYFLVTIYVYEGIHRMFLAEVLIDLSLITVKVLPTTHGFDLFASFGCFRWCWMKLTFPKASNLSSQAHEQL